MSPPFVRSRLLIAAAFSLAWSATPGLPRAAATPDFVDIPAGSLDAFHASLVGARAGDSVARVLVYGASHTADDSYTSELRSLLQRHYGDGGPGWVMPASPFPFYDHADVEFGGHGFSGLFVRGRQRRRAIYGLAGFALEARAGAGARIHHGRSVGQVGVHYLMQPGGGRLNIEMRGHEPWRIDTSGALEVRHEQRPLTARHGLGVRLRVEGGAARIFGVVLENASGVVVDAWGVPGARVWDQEPWRLDALSDEARARPASLLVLAYGTNESANARVSIADVERREGRALRRLKGLYAGASCLLVGPGDWPRRDRHGLLVPRPRLLAVRRVQRRVAGEQGCAFFDTYAFMGGEGSMARWMAEGLALDDHVHFTYAGSRRLGRALYRTLTRQASE